MSTRTSETVGFGDGWMLYDGDFVGVEFNAGQIQVVQRRRDLNYHEVLASIGNYNPGQWYNITLNLDAHGELHVTGDFEGSVPTIAVPVDHYFILAVCNSNDGFVVRDVAASNPVILFSRASFGSDVNDLYTIKPDGSEVQLLYQDPGTAVDGSWLRDKTKIVYRSNASTTGKMEAFMINADGTDRTQVTAADNDVSSPRFYDNNAIWFIKHLGYHQMDLFSIDLTSQSETRLTDYQSESQAMYDFAFNGTAVTLGIEADVCGTGELFLTNSDFSGSQTRLTTGYFDLQAKFSPDGSKIVFAREPASCGNRPMNLWVMNADGTDLRQLTFGIDREAYLSPSWSPDGTQLVCSYNSSDYNQCDLVVMNADGSGQANITMTADFSESSPEWAATSATGPLPDRLYFPSLAIQPCDSCSFASGPTEPAAVQSMVCDLIQEAVAATISVKIPEGVDVCDVSFAGLPTDAWDQKGAIIKPDSGFLTVYLANAQGLTLPTGSTTLFNIEFLAPRLCRENYFIHWDTALSADEARRSEFTGTDFRAFPVGFDYGRDSTENVGYMPGDLNGTRSVTISDVSTLINYLFINGRSLCNLNAADVNHSCGNKPTISDVALLIDSLFVGQHRLECGCIGEGAPPVPKARPDIGVLSAFDGDHTTFAVASPVALRALQLELSGPDGARPEDLLGDRLNLFCGQTGTQVQVGMIDIDSGQTIPAGTTSVLRIPGEYEIVSALVVDEQMQEIVPIINGAMHNAPLPTAFALAQNYPNPFNPVTDIAFAVPVACDVTLEVFNVLGQKVATLLDGRFDAGEHSVTWDATAQSSGVYLYRLTASEVVETKKMLLLK